MFLRVLRALRGMISLSMVLNDPGMLCCDEPEKVPDHELRHYDIQIGNQNRIFTFLLQEKAKWGTDW